MSTSVQASAALKGDPKLVSYSVQVVDGLNSGAKVGAAAAAAAAAAAVRLTSCGCIMGMEAGLPGVSMPGFEGLATPHRMAGSPCCGRCRSPPQVLYNISGCDGNILVLDRFLLPCQVGGRERGAWGPRACAWRSPSSHLAALK
jgi:hypothetical protein